MRLRPPAPPGSEHTWHVTTLSGRLPGPNAFCPCPALQELAHQDIIRQLKLEHAKEITKLRQEFELQARELQQKYEKKMKMLRDDMELRRKQVGLGGR